MNVLVAVALPAGFVCVAVIVCDPSDSVDESHVHFPDESAVVIHSVVPLSVTVTVDPGAAVPEIAGVGSFVVEPSAGEVITGAAGGGVEPTPRTMNVSGADTAETFPAAS
ncbi:hypothetical protein, partial [Amycolatopsis sp. SID8362]|uniref:hypothetical protein n=1 Tax=Amycolatopsis sp. SID8362 TaxID=2690346 RepID=UPI0013703FC7